MNNRSLFLQSHEFSAGPSGSYDTTRHVTLWRNTELSKVQYGVLACMCVGREKITLRAKA